MYTIVMNELPPGLDNIGYAGLAAILLYWLMTRLSQDITAIKESNARVESSNARIENLLSRILEHRRESHD